MSKRLFKVATELNVGTHTIVEFLNNSGFEIEDKPNAKLSEEMLSELLKEFQSSAVIKEQADQLVIGSRPVAKKESSVSVLSDGEEELPPEPSPKQEAPRPEAEEEAESKSEKEPQEEERPARAKPRLKVLGKIDLAEKGKAKPKPKSKKKEDEKEKQPEREEVEQKVEKAPEKKAAEPEKAPGEKPTETENAPAAEKGEEKPAPTEPAPKASEEEGEQSKKPGLIRAEAPELRGLKIQGKIDLEKFDSKKKKKEKEDDKKPSEGGSDTGRKRKRRRRRVAVDRKGNRQQGGRGRRSSKEEEVREVSQKEIEEKIKATMARLSGGGKKKRQKMRRESRERIRERQEMREMEQQSDKLQVTEFISVQELANLMDKDATEVITACMNLGVIVSINQRLDAEIIELVASEFGYEIEFISAEEQTEEEEEIVDDPEDLEPRAPIVTVMGHVDHGKTSLLDYVRKANVASGEAGGITQHIGAYEVEVPQDDEHKKITFLDTPGHEAFTAMRARGAKVTDIAVIIIAADDSIMPQTREAISHAQAAGVPIIFAINKVDKAGADPDRIKQELANMNLLVEDWGGKIQSQDISAKTGQGVDELLEKILLEAEILELQANPDRFAVGTILEASLEKGRGYVAKALVQTGTLEIGDPMVAGEFSGKVKAMFNERGKRVKEAGPSTPVLILGLDGAPQAGERLKVMENEQEARQIASKRGQIAREQANRATKRISLDEIGRRIALGSFKELNLIVKGDVDGSVEALADSLIKESIESIQVNIIHKGVGQIVDSDVMLASASDAIIIGFQVRPSLSARKLAEQEGVEIKLYSVIYNAIEEIKLAIEGMLEPTQEENIVGQVEVRETYKISKVGTVAGCYVQEGKINRNNNVRVIRDGIVIYPTKEGVVGELASLKRFKDDVKEVKNGMECGVSIKNFNDIKVGDIIEAYEIVQVKQTLA
jgi:translation initiation factor IF-2